MVLAHIVSLVAALASVGVLVVVLVSSLVVVLVLVVASVAALVVAQVVAQASALAMVQAEALVAWSVLEHFAALAVAVERFEALPVSVLEQVESYIPPYSFSQVDCYCMDVPSFLALLLIVPEQKFSSRVQHNRD